MPIEYKGVIIRRALPTGGKAGKGRNKTTSLYCNVGFNFKKVVYSKTDVFGYIKALEKCRAFIDQHTADK